MRYPASEKAEIIQLVEQSHLPASGTIRISVWSGRLNVTLRHGLDEAFAEDDGELSFAMDHSRGGILHSFSERLNIRYNSLVAASSLGKWPLALTARLSFEFSASMAFVV